MSLKQRRRPRFAAHSHDCRGWRLTAHWCSDAIGRKISARNVASTQGQMNLIPFTRCVCSIPIQSVLLYWTLLLDTSGSRRSCRCVVRRTDGSTSRHDRYSIYMCDQLFSTLFVLTTCRNNAVSESKFTVGHQHLNTCIVVNAWGHANYSSKEIKHANKINNRGLYECYDIQWCLHCRFDHQVPFMIIPRRHYCEMFVLYSNTESKSVHNCFLFCC